MFDDNGVKIGSRYTISYIGYLFYGDSDGLNIHGCDSWDDAQSLINAYGYEDDLEFEVRDNLYSVTWKKGDWY